MKISKSRYTDYKTCPKLLWLNVNKPDLAIPDPTAQKHIDDGKEVGRVAKGYFPNTVDTTTYKEDGSLDVSNMIGLTNRYLAVGNKVIAEASFSIDNLFCSIDLLKPVEDGYEIKLDCGGVKPSDIQVEENGVITYTFLAINTNITCSVTTTPIQMPAEDNGN